jgi:hypothetical protein
MQLHPGDLAEMPEPHANFWSGFVDVVVIPIDFHHCEWEMLANHEHPITFRHSMRKSQIVPGRVGSACRVVWNRAPKLLEGRQPSLVFQPSEQRVE